MTTHPLQWHCPQPLWARFGPTPAAAVDAPDQYRPALLRFASDAFMDQLLAALARDPAGIADLLARPETWRSPPQDDAGVPLTGAGEALIDRLPLPRFTRAAARGLALRQPRTAVAAVPSTQPVKEKTAPRVLPLKLYQPAHQRFYLVSASLVCGRVGLPDRAVTRGGSEQLGFVLRRQLPADPATDPTGTPQEYAYVKGLDAGSWQRVSAAGTAASDAVLVPGEEQLPVFPLAYRDAAGHTRTLWTGMIPVGRREEYLGAVVETATATSLAAGQRQALGPRVSAPPANSKMARLTQFKMEVAEPWKALIRSVYQARESMAETLDEAEDTNADRTARLQRLNLQWQGQSWLILLDLADFLEVYLPQVWQAVTDAGTAAALAGLANPNPAALYQWLGTATNSALLAAAIGESPRKAVKANLREALAAIRADGVRERLEAAETLYTDDTRGAADWPGFHFLLAGLDGTTGPGARPNPQPAGAFLALSGLDPAVFSGPGLDPGGLSSEPGPAQAASPPKWFAAQLAAEALDRLTALVGRALEAGPETQAPPLPFALQVRDALAAAAARGDQGWFVVRLVHVNRDCGPLHPPNLSAPTQRFQLASFFDPDAPARPIRISLPRDTTPAGLRRHSRGTAFVISDILCGQIQRAKGLGLVDLVRSVLPWPLHKDLEVGAGGKCSNGGIDIGMICSLSIPIITICALILLIIMVSLLDFVFRWLPYFVICFPVPKLKGKTEVP